MPHLSWRSQLIAVTLCSLILPIANAQLTQVEGTPDAAAEDSSADQIGEVNIGHGKLAPPIIPGAPEGAMKFFEGVWDIELKNDDGSLNMVAVLSKGLTEVSQRTSNADWSLSGVTYRPTSGGEGIPPVVFRGEDHLLVGFNGKIEYLSASAMQVFIHADGSGVFRIRVRRSGAGTLLGRWRDGDNKGVAIWKKRAPIELTAIRFDSRRTDELNQPIVSTVRPGDVGEIRLVHPVNCQYGNMRGNCSTAAIQLIGRNLVGPHEAWIDPEGHMEMDRISMVSSQGANAWANYDMAGNAARSGAFDAIHIPFYLWTGMTPGPRVLWFDGQPYPFNVVITGYLEETEDDPEPLPDPILESISVTDVDGNALDQIVEGSAFRVTAKYDIDHPHPWVQIDLEAQDPAAGEALFISTDPDAVSEITLWRSDDYRTFESSLYRIAEDRTGTGYAEDSR